MASDDLIIQGWFDEDLIDTAAAGAYTLTCQSGAYSISGQSATLLRSKLITANSGTYSIAGQAANLLRSKLIAAQSGSYSISGQDAILTHGAGAANYTLTCQYGTYTVAGQSANLLRSKVITAQAGSYSVTGQSANLSKGFVLTAQYGTYAVSGQSADLLKSKVIAANSGSYSINGQDAVLTKSGGAANYTLTCLHGTYRVGGNYVEPGYWDEGYVVGGANIEISRLRVDGGDDAPHHTGWDKKAWQKRKKREDAIGETIRETYERLMGIAPAPEVVKSVVAEVKKTQPEVIKAEITDYSGLAEWLTAQQAIVAEIIARRQEEDDEEALLLLL